MQLISVSLIIAVCCSTAVGNNRDHTSSGFSLAAYYASHMVLQRAPQKASIWGYAPFADIGSTVTVTVNATWMPLISVNTIVQEDLIPHRATWKVTLPPIAVTSPSTVTAVLNNYKPIVLNDVLFGDVWVCSGQSNMNFVVGEMLDSAAVLAEASNYANAIRFFSVGEVLSNVTVEDLLSIEKGWSVPSASSLWSFSAVCWMYGKNIYDVRGVPMGLVESAYGGSNIGQWSSRDALRVCGVNSTSQQDLEHGAVLTNKQQVIQLDNYNDNYKTNSQEQVSVTSPNNIPFGYMWNAMIHPLLKITIFGVVWYQGEANHELDNDIYTCMFTTLIADWRQKWFSVTQGLTDPIFPFGFVQIGPLYDQPSPPSPPFFGFPNVRWHQTADIGYAPNDILRNTFMAVAMDLTDTVTGVHYRDKATVARRLALAGLSIAYNIQGLRYQGPWVTAVFIVAEAHLFNLVYDSGKYPIAVRNTTGFEICCQSGGCAMDGTDWFPAPVIPDGSPTSVKLNASLCTDMELASALRYAWRATPFTYLGAAVYSVDYNLPAPPFIMYNQLRNNKWYHGYPSTSS